MEENSGERKKCNKCAMMIPKEAKICPFCRKQQGWSLFTKFFLVVAILFLVTMIVNQIKNNTSTTGQPPNIDSSKQEQNMQKSTPPAPVVQKATPPNTDAIVHNMNVLRKAGLVTKVVPAEVLTAEVEALAKTMATKAPISLRYIKEAINKGLDLTMEQGLRLEADLYFLLHTTGDRTEGIKAFQQKSPPEFNGQ